jgi:DNA topoisomerase-1
MNLVIVESPTKAKTIGKFLGKEYKVESSFGHVRDLPKSELGVDVENKYEPRYVIPTKSRKNVTALKKAAAASDKVILATDEDREGEAIAWHLSQAIDLKDKPAERIVFHEITKSAIKKALDSPREIKLDLVDAQQARRVLDRLVGYKLSPFLWKKVFRGLSAGRVQSVAVRLIADREEERKAFKKDEYWTITSILNKEGEEKKSFEANLNKINEKALDKLDIKTQAEAEKIKKDLEDTPHQVVSVNKKESRRNALAPFTTSTLQQESSRRLHMSARQTMRFAQGLYEKGRITYMRTDSVNLSQESLVAARDWIKANLGKEYLTEKPRVFKAKSRLAQEAHEAVRPTDPSFLAEKLSGQEAKLYDLIWRRFIASQLPPAVFDATTVDILAAGKEKYELRANGNILKFDGFLKIWPSKISEKELPSLENNDELNLIEVKDEQHFTEPPPRYNEASLIKALEEHGIGRPSTYAPTISVIQDRNYVEKDESKRFSPTEVGVLVNNLLKEHFPSIVDIGFTAEMEEDLDKIAEGKQDWRTVIGDFYEPFEKNLAEKYEEVEKATPEVKETTDEVCDKCGKPMIIKLGRFGKFLACSGFPDCKSTKMLITDQNSFGPCPECKEGSVIQRRTKKRRFFYGCSKYPDCKHASWKKPGEEEEKKEDS